MYTSMQTCPTTPAPTLQEDPGPGRTRSGLPTFTVLHKAWEGGHMTSIYTCPLDVPPRPPTLDPKVPEPLHRRRLCSVRSGGSPAPFSCDRAQKDYEYTTSYCHYNQNPKKRGGPAPLPYAT